MVRTFPIRSGRRSSGLLRALFGVRPGRADVEGRDGLIAISFAGSPRGGVRMDLRTPLRWGPLRLRAVYAGVEDLEGFAAALSSIGIPGEDARTSR